MYERVLDLKSIVKNKSLFLFGPRQTGKTSLLHMQFPKTIRYDLLKSDTFLDLATNPALIRERHSNDKTELIIIDEIQKLPVLLDEVHYLIEEKKIKFILTGSSPRKLKKPGINMLGGRCRSRYLHPLSIIEITDTKLEKIFQHGLIPSIFDSDSPDEDLKSYVGDYLQQEIALEGVFRNIPAFGRFLEVAALCNSYEMNISKIANDSMISRSTLQEYIHILTDTLIGYELPLFQKIKGRKPQRNTKLYFFDVGVARILQGRKYITPKTREFGEFFETYIFHELMTHCDYKQQGPLTYWREGDYEVDFVIDDHTAIEVKSTTKVSSDDLKGLKKISEAKTFKRLCIISQEKEKRVIDNIEIWPWKDFIFDLYK